jgi:hypothetical protein
MIQRNESSLSRAGGQLRLFLEGVVQIVLRPKALRDQVANIHAEAAKLYR